MDVVYERAAGLDISKRDAKVCLRLPAGRRNQFTKTVTTYGSTVSEIERLRQDLEAAEIEVVVMEATGDYWKPFFFTLAETLNVELVNARQVKNMPGRKTDVLDAQWLAELAAHNMLRSSFVPPERIRELRDLTRTRRHLGQEQHREWARLEKNLEDSGIKISSVLSTLGSQTGRRILDALVAGERDPEALAALAHASLAKKTPVLIESLRGRFRDHHAFMVRLHLRRIDAITEDIAAITDQIERVIEPFRGTRELLMTIPGIKENAADTIIAEIGADMSVFPTAGHLASWAGVAPGLHQSAGRIKSAHINPGDAYLKAALGIVVFTIIRSKNGRLYAKYRRVSNRTGGLKAVVAIEHTLLTIIWNMLRNGVPYDELGSDYYRPRHPERTRDNALRTLATLGYDVTLTPRTA